MSHMIDDSLPTVLIYSAVELIIVFGRLKGSRDMHELIVSDESRIIISTS